MERESVVADRFSTLVVVRTTHWYTACLQVSTTLVALHRMLSVVTHDAPALPTHTHSRRQRLKFIYEVSKKVKCNRSFVIAPLCRQCNRSRSACRAAQVGYLARTKQRRTYLPYTFPAVAGTHLPAPKGWRVVYAQAQGGCEEQLAHG